MPEWIPPVKATAPSPVAHPAMRLNLAMAAWSLADADFQAHVWARPHEPTPNGAFYFDLAIVEIFDTGLLDDPGPPVVGLTLANVGELSRVRALAASLDRAFEQTGKPNGGITYADVAQTAGWNEVRSNARMLLDALIDGGGISVADPLVPWNGGAIG